MRMGCSGCQTVTPCATVWRPAGRPATTIKAMTKSQSISALILARVANGETLKEAFDAVLGAGAYERLAGEVWSALQPA
jgi:hypothetical protein